MSHPFESKGIFAWQLFKFSTEDPSDFTQKLVTAGFQSVIIKVAHGTSVFRTAPQGELLTDNLTKAQVDSLHDHGISVVGYGRLFGQNPQGEAEIAVSQCEELGLDGYVWDVEQEFEDSGNASGKARQIMEFFQSHTDNIPSGCCSWKLFRNPATGSNWHDRRFVEAFMEFCEYGLPMIYWRGNTAENANQDLINSLEQWHAFTDKPIIPVGRAYQGDGGDATVEAVLAFDQKARELGVKGITWWVLDQAASPRYKNGTIFEALKTTVQFGSGSQPEDDTVTDVHEPTDPDETSTQPEEGTATMIKGLDVSNNEWNVDWDVIKNSEYNNFVYIRAGQGTLKDERFDHHWQGAKQAGIPRGAYWVYDPRYDLGKPKRQAEAFLQALESDLGELPIVADIEKYTTGKWHGWERWYDFIEYTKDLLPEDWIQKFSNLGIQPIMVYTGFNYWTNEGPKPDEGNAHSYFAKYPLWLAWYGLDAQTADLSTTPENKNIVPLRNWNTWTFWQYADKSTLEGVTSDNGELTDVDMNVYNGTEAEFKNHFGLNA